MKPEKKIKTSPWARFARNVRGLLALLLIPTFFGLMGCAKGEMDKTLDETLKVLEIFAPKNQIIEAEISQLEGSLLAGLRNLVYSVEFTFKAAGLEKDAQRMALIQKRLQDEPEIVNDPDRLKEIMDEVNLATTKANAITAEKKFNREKAKEFVGRGILHTGIAIVYDVKAINHAHTLIQVVPKAIEQNAMEALRLRRYLNLSRLVLTNVPDQLKQIKSINQNLQDYSKDHNIPQPSQAEIDKAVKKQAPAKIDAGDL